MNDQDFYLYCKNEADRLYAQDGIRRVLARGNGHISTLESQSPIGGTTGGNLVVYETCPPANATPKNWEAMYLGGRIADGRGRSSGKIVHLVSGDVAMCGKEYGRRSAGWFTTNEAVNCPKCLRLAKVQQ
jgi:hypothetical protein